MRSLSRLRKTFSSSVSKCLSSGRRVFMAVLLLLLLSFMFHKNLSRESRFNKYQSKAFSFLQKIWISGPSLSHNMKQVAGPLETQRAIFPSRLSTVWTTKACHPKSHIVFLKTHKTGSSTIQNILYRYGDIRNLTFALPHGKDNRFDYGSLFRSAMVEGFRSRTFAEYNIICNHMRFDKAEVAKVMPEDSFYFSILRHPVPMMESMFVYMKGVSSFPTKFSLEEMLSDNLRKKSSVASRDFTHNNLAFDFGLDNRVTADSVDLEERAVTAIAKIEREFHLILINDYFEESMILLRHALCWSLDDVVSFKLNSRSDATRVPVSPQIIKKIKQWNALDWKIYLHFNVTFWQKVKSEVGVEEMKKEVSALRELQAKLTSSCLKEGQPVHPKQIQDAGLKPFQSGDAIILGYNLNTGLDQHTAAKCRQLITPELQYTKQLYNKQFSKTAGGQ